MNKTRIGIISFAALVGAVGIAYGAGSYSTLPQVGEASFCAAQVTTYTGQSCQVTVPAGPTALTGSEIVPADTQITGSAPPQTVTVPMPLFPAGAFTYNGGNSYPLTVTIPNNTNLYMLDPTTTISTLSLTLPSSPLNGQLVRFSSSATITTLLVFGAGTQSVTNKPTSLAIPVNAPMGYAWVWVASTNLGTPGSWMRVQ